jgi:hypothetical protein
MICVGLDELGSRKLKRRIYACPGGFSQRKQERAKAELYILCQKYNNVCLALMRSERERERKRERREMEHFCLSSGCFNKVP